MKKFFSDFQNFINRGNVMDMAVGIIIGAAFSTIVQSLVKDIITPILGFFVGKQDFSGLFFVLKVPEGYTGLMTYDALSKAGATILGYGAFLTNVFNFLLLAFVIFCLIRLVNKIKEKSEKLLLKEKEEEEKKAAPITPEDTLLLREILATLKTQK